MYLGVRVVIAKTIERIHKANLINFCIVPIEFANPADYERVNKGDRLKIANLKQAVASADEITIVDETAAMEFAGKLALSPRDREILLAGGLLSYTRNANR